MTTSIITPKNGNRKDRSNHTCTRGAKVEHIIMYLGYSFSIYVHQYVHSTNTKFVLWMDGLHGYEFTKLKNGGLKVYLDKMIKEYEARQVRDAYYDSRKGLSAEECLNHPDFLYARYNVYFGEGCYTFYFRDKYSPTGVSSNGGCNEADWNVLSKKTGNSHNYVVGNEGRQSAR